MSEEKFEDNNTPQDYAAPQDYNDPGMQETPVCNNAGSQAETSKQPVKNWQEQSEQAGYQNPGSYQSQTGYQSQGNYQGQMGYQNPGTDQNMWQQQYVNPQGQPNEPGKGFAIASMILGIVSLVLFCTCINLPLALAAIILAIVQFVKSGKNGMAIAGLITGIASIVLFIVFWVLISFGAINDGLYHGYDLPYDWEEEFDGDFDFDNTFDL